MSSTNTPDVNVDEERMNKSIKTLKSWASKINDILEDEFDNHIERAKKIHPEGVRMFEYLKEYTMRGGKRLRPSLVVAGYKAVGGKRDEIFPASTSMEAMHNYLIIHDDIMDQDDMRRNGPTLHKMYRDLHKEKSFSEDPDRFGENMGINAGDLTSSFATDQLAKSDFPAEKKIKAIRKFEDIHRHTGYGQVLDVMFNYKSPKDVEEKDTDQVYRLKTAHYTVAGPLELGAILGDGTEEQKQKLKEYGMMVGRAFQLADDLLVMYGDEEKLGKKVGTDLEEGNKTVPILKAYEMGNEEQKRIIEETMGKDNVSKERVQRIGEIIEETGAFDYCKRKVEKQAKKGKDAIRNVEDLDSDMRDFLLGIADYIIAREK